MFLEELNAPGDVEMDACPLLHGVGRALLHPDAVQLGFRASLLGIMGGL